VVAVSDAVERVKRYCDVAGMEPSEPLRLALVTTCEASEEARAEIRRMLNELHGVAAKLPSAIALSPEAEKELVSRVVTRLASETWRELVSLARKIRFAAWIGSLALTLALIGIGYLLGSWRSDAVSLLETCRGGDVKISAENGRRYCVMSVWLDPAPRK
jgi:hypothetical protein